MKNTLSSFSARGIPARDRNTLTPYRLASLRSLAGLAALCLMGAMLQPVSLQSATLAYFPFTGNTLADAADNPLVTVTDLTVGSLNNTSLPTITGYSTSSAGDPSVTESGVPVLLTSNFQTTVPANYRYLTFTVTPDEGYEMDITSFGFWGYTAADSIYPNEYVLAIIVDDVEHQLTSGQVANTFTLYEYSIIPGTYVTSDSVEFRIYGQGFGQFGNDTLRIDDVKVMGVIPEPSQIMLIALAGIFAFAVRMRRSA